MLDGMGSMINQGILGISSDGDVETAVSAWNDNLEIPDKSGPNKNLQHIINNNKIQKSHIAMSSLMDPKALTRECAFSQSRTTS